MVITALVVAAVTIWGGYQGAATSDEAPREAGDARRAGAFVGRGQVTQVIDGDTVEVVLEGGRRQRVRLLGIDSPERTTLRTGRTECGGEDARRAAQALATRWPGVTLRSDPGQDTYDRYGRLLAYVVPDASTGTTYQQALLAAGWAEVFVFDRRAGLEREAEFRRAASDARGARAGVWARCGGDFRRPL